MSEREHSYEEIMDRLGEVTGRGGWQLVESYFEYMMSKKLEQLVDELDDRKANVVRGEIKTYQYLLRLRQDVLDYNASSVSSAPEESVQPE